MKHISELKDVQPVKIDAVAAEKKSAPKKFSLFFGDLGDGHTPVVINKRLKVIVRSRRRTKMAVI